MHSPQIPTHPPSAIPVDAERAIAGPDAPGGTDATDDRRLVERLLAGEEAAYDTFAAHHIPRLYRYALSRVRQADEAEDVVQSTLAVAFEKLAEFRGDAALLTWMCGICRFEIANRRRRASRSPMVEMSDDDTSLDRVLERLAEEDEGPEDHLERRELSRRVHQTLDHLPEHYGRALEWKYLEGTSVAEIARRLGVGAKAAESLLTRARVAFRQAFETLAQWSEPADVTPSAAPSRP